MRRRKVGTRRSCDIVPGMGDGLRENRGMTAGKGHLGYIRLTLPCGAAAVARVVLRVISVNIHYRVCAREFRGE